MYRTNYFNSDADKNIINFIISQECLQVLNVLTGSSLLHMHLTFLRNMDNRTRRQLKDTVLVNEAYVAYCHIFHAEKALLERRRDDDLENLQYGCKILASLIDL